MEGAHAVEPLLRDIALLVEDLLMLGEHLGDRHIAGGRPGRPTCRDSVRQVSEVSNRLVQHPLRARAAAWVDGDRSNGGVDEEDLVRLVPKVIREVDHTRCGVSVHRGCVASHADDILGRHLSSPPRGWCR